MKKSVLKSLLSAFFLLTNITIIPFAGTSCSKKPEDPTNIDLEIAKHDQNAWEHTIQELSDSKIPTIYLNHDAAFNIIQDTLLFFSTDALAKQKDYTYANVEYKYADHISLVLSKSYKYKTKESPGLFAYNYGQFVSGESGHSDILVDGIDNANNMLISNLEDFDISKSTYTDFDNNVLDFDKFENFITAYQKIFDMYDQASGKKMQFNFVFNDYLSQFIPEYLYTKFMGLVLSRANKIYMVSDGMASWGITKDYYVDLWKKYGFISSTKQKEIWDKLHNATSIEQASKIYSENKIALWNNEKYFEWFAADGNFYRAPMNCHPSIKLYPEYWTKYSRCILDWTLYKSLFNMTDKTYDLFSNNLKHFYNYVDGHSFDDYVSYGTYDLNKKNLIISLPEYLNIVNSTRDKNVIEIFDQIRTNYPNDKYNYIYKAHPRATQTQIEDAIKRIFNNVLPENTIILKNTFPLEFLELLDWDLVNSGIETKYHLVDPKSFVNDWNEVSGSFAGFSFDTSCVMSTLCMLAYYKDSEAFLLGWENALKLLTDKSMYIPTKFNFFSDDVGDAYDANLDMIKYFYRQFTQINEFHELDYFNKV